MSVDIISVVKFFYEIMKDEKIYEFEVNSKDYKIYIKRKIYNNTNELANSDTNANEFIYNKNKKNEFSEISVSSNELLIKSPIVGVFYRSPSPSMVPFVNEGDIVEKGDILCIIEAMKIMNEIKAAFKLKILEVLVKNGKLVNLDHGLFKVKKI
jgi:acetyl-CoA carboxylase biotin carboxyl carrier protein